MNNRLGAAEPRVFDSPALGNMNYSYKYCNICVFKNLEKTTDHSCSERNILFVSVSISAVLSLLLNVSIENCIQKKFLKLIVSFCMVLKINVIESLPPISVSTEK